MNNIFSINNTFRHVYVVILIFLSIYFFIHGINRYNVELSSINYKLKNLNDTKELYSNYENNFEMSELDENKLNSQNIDKRFFKLPYTISKFSSKLNKKNWINDNTNNNILENSQIASLLKRMAEDNYDLDQVSFTKIVPNFVVDKLPKDISYIEDTKIRKKIFISIVLPLIVENNKKINLKRNRLLNIYEKLAVSKTLSLTEHNWLMNLAVEYSVNTKHVHKITIAKTLLNHVDIIPNSIAIAQAAKESGWGTSRFAKEGNALFGQWTYDNANGLLPSQRNEGEEHFIRSFGNLKESVISYMYNINSHNAYDLFREKRKEFRSDKININSLILVQELKPYAESPDYTDILYQIIKTNNLQLFDNVELSSQSSLV